MYGVNDVYDYESDMQNPRKGSVEGAVVAKKYHRFLLQWSSLLPVPFIIALGVLGNTVSALILAACLFFVVAYSVKGLRFKEIPILDSITSSLHFVGPLLYALSLVGWPPEAWPIVIAFFLWGVASQSFGAVQDIVADRAAHLKSIATVFGARVTVYFSLTAYILAIVIIALTGPYGVVVALAACSYAISITPYLSITDKTAEQTRAGWRRFLWINYLVGAVVTLAILAAYWNS